MKKTQIVISGDNVETLKNYPDNYFDSVVTDCPYGLGKEPNAQEMLKAWVDTGYLEVKGSGFMGKEWDAFVPQPLFWKEIYRVLKHGGHVIAFFGTRTYDWGCMAIRLGGFEIRDCIQWVYGSGFPKSHNVGKAIDKIQGNEREIIGEKNRGDVEKAKKKGVGYLADVANRNNVKQFGYGTETITKGSSEWEGWGTALKPANEPIVLARKPLEKGLSIAENVLKWGTGAINIDVSRIGNELIKGQKAGQGFNNVKGFGVNTKIGDENAKEYISEDVNGRFPSNFILTHHEDCEDWNCHDDCPIKILDEQSGILNKQGISKSDNKSGWQNNYVGGNGVNAVQRKLYLDKGGASRFFYVAKASQWERNFGLDGFEEKQTTGGGGGIGNYLEDINSASGKYGSEKAPSKNIHPTVKPIKLMQYLVRMITPPNGIVLDPFCGSGTTGIACKIDGFEFVGLELSEEFTEIANQRIKSFNEEKLLLDETKIFKTRNKKENTITNTQNKEQLNLF